jgi:hypothetical protein
MSSIFLTGYPDVEVFDVEGLSEVEQIARIRPDEGKIQRTFGVSVKGTATPLPTARAADEYLESLIGRKQRSPTLSMPVLPIVFSMQDDRGYVAWQAEPVVEGAEPKLRLPGRLETEPATRETLRSIVDRVSEWYDLLLKNLYVTAR